MQKTIEDFAKAIDLNRSTVINGPKKVTIFGGKTSNTGGPPTQRGIFLLFASKLSDSFVVPETIKSWNHFGTYKDLLSFEEDICSIVDGVLVFLESPGAIAELGCLVKNPEIARKLLVVVNNEHYEESFIRHGMLKYLDEAFKEVNVISSQNGSLGAEEIEYITSEIQRRMNDVFKTEQFRIGHLRHEVFLLVDFIELIQVARISDIQHFFEALELGYSKTRLEQIIFSLKNVGLIHERQILNERCIYVDPTLGRPYIEYGFNSSTAKRMSWKANLFVKTNSDKWRKFAFKVLKTPPPMETKEVLDAAA